MIEVSLRVGDLVWGRTLTDEQRESIALQTEELIKQLQFGVIKPGNA